MKKYIAQKIISIFFNLWTSSNSIVFIIITVYFINESACLYIVLFELYRIIGLHVGEIITKQLI